MLYIGELEMAKIKRATPKDIEELNINTERPVINPEETEKHRIHKGQHIDNPYKTLEELEAVKDSLDPQLYAAAKADLTRDERVASLSEEFPWDDEMSDEKVPEFIGKQDGCSVFADKTVVCPTVVKDTRPKGPVAQPGYLFADRIMTAAESIADYVVQNLNANHFDGNGNVFSIPLNLNNGLLASRFDARWSLDSRVRIFDLLEAACAMVCQLGERGRLLDKRIDAVLPPVGPGKAYGIVSIFIDDENAKNIFLRINVQKGLR